MTGVALAGPPSAQWWRQTPRAAAVGAGGLGWMFDVCDNFFLAPSTVALHAGNAPYHGLTFDYADYFSADHAMISTGNKPFY